MTFIQTQNADTLRLLCAYEPHKQAQLAINESFKFTRCVHGVNLEIPQQLRAVQSSIQKDKDEAKCGSVHEDQASCTPWPLMLPPQICFATAGTQSIILAGLNIFAIMQGKACPALLQLNGILVLDLVAIVNAIWLDAALVRLRQHDITYIAGVRVCLRVNNRSTVTHAQGLGLHKS